MGVCQIEEREAGRSYPRTCPTCRIGNPCAKGLDHKGLQDRIAALEAENERLRKALEDARADEMRAYGPIPISEDTAAIIEAVQTWVNQRGGEESLEQIVAMTAEAMRRASRRALEGGE